MLVSLNLKASKLPWRSPGVGEGLEAGEDDGVGGAAAGVQQVDAVLVIPADGLQVPGEDAKDGLLVHLDPQEELLAEPGAGDVLAGGGGDPGESPADSGDGDGLTSV